MALNPDFKDLLTAFADERVDYLIVGGYAVAFHGQPRYTKDIDLLVSPTGDNIERVACALERFGAPTAVIDELRTAREDEIVWIGQPPLRIDLLRSIPGVEFSGVWSRRETAEWDGVPVLVIGVEDLISAKRAAGRPQDLVDAGLLEDARKR